MATNGTINSSGHSHNHYVSNATLNGSSSHWQTGATGSWSQSYTNMTLKQKTIDFTKGSGAQYQPGDMHMDLDEGCLKVYDGNEWLQVTDGLEEKTKIEKIKDELMENYPEALFDLIIKGLI